MQFDPDTGELVDGGGDRCPHCEGNLRERVQAEADLQAAEKELRRLRREATCLRNELQRQRSESSEGKAAQALGRYWVARCEKNPKRTVVGEKRQRAIIARLRDGYTPQYVARAIDGLAEFAYTNPQTGHRYDDVELVCRDESKLERFYDLAERGNVRTLVGSAWLDEFGVSDPTVDPGAPF